MRYSFRLTSLFLLFFSLSASVSAEETYVCIWRNPERTMMRIFPEAEDYKTIRKKISPEQLKTIEGRAGKLLPGQRELFQYFELTDNTNRPLGYIFASSQKGEYGAIEFVFGLDNDKKINGIYIQRSRERNNEFKKKAFLDRFIGRGITDIESMETGKDIKADSSTGNLAVLSGVKKELAAFDLLAD